MTTASVTPLGGDGRLPEIRALIEGIKGVYLDFGYVIGCPKPGTDRRFLYLDWDGIIGILEDKEISHCLRSGVGQRELETFFQEEIYQVFVQHENTDLIDPKSGMLIFEKLPIIIGCQIDQELVDRLLTHIDTMKYIEIYSSAQEILAYLRRKNYRISMITNMMLPGKLLRQKLRSNNILDYFDTITISSEVGFMKPRTEIFLQTTADDNLQAQEIVFVGDTYAQDIVGAKSVGMRTVWLNVRNESTCESDAADYQISDIRELLKLL